MDQYIKVPQIERKMSVTRIYLLKQLCLELGWYRVPLVLIKCILSKPGWKIKTGGVKIAKVCPKNMKKGEKILGLSDIYIFILFIYFE